MDRNASWTKERILKRLRLEVESREFAGQYEMLMSREPALARFGPPEGLIGALHDPRGASLDQKDELLHALVRTLQTRPDVRRCAQTLLALGMWPGLEHANYELLHLSRRVPDLFEEIYWAFLKEVASHDTAKRWKMAVNLRLNTKKRVNQAVADEDYYRDFVQAHAFVATDLDLLLEEPRRNRASQIKERVESISSPELRRCLRRAAESRGGRDSFEAALMEDAANDWMAAGHLTEEDLRLVVDHAVRGLSLAQIGRELGLSEVAARVRYHRIKRKLAESLAREPRCA